MKKYIVGFLKGLLSPVFFLIDAVFTVKDIKAFRAIVFMVLLFAYVLGGLTYDLVKEYGSIAFHRWFKTEIMEKPIPVTNINSDIPNTESTNNEDKLN
ncbi:MAG: hypothetical protein KQ78_02128 [Candidatus Izimaplasma bacterium HR2]|nr:MAG: hypothetical protein KQ78_02128 [Candidatus Izimaplasma bacterium HR2]